MVKPDFVSQNTALTANFEVERENKG